MNEVVLSLRDNGYRCSYQRSIQTFFWVDTDFYNANKQQIIEWAARHDCKMESHKYGWIKVPNDRIEMLFRLTWAGKSYG